MASDDLTTKVVLVEEQVNRNKDVLKELGVTINGDGNGRKGIVRRLDLIEYKVVGLYPLLGGLFAKMVYDWFFAK